MFCANTCEIYLKKNSLCPPCSSDCVDSAHALFTLTLTQAPGSRTCPALPHLSLPHLLRVASHLCISTLSSCYKQMFTLPTGTWITHIPSPAPPQPHGACTAAQSGQLHMSTQFMCFLHSYLHRHLDHSHAQPCPTSASHCHPRWPATRTRSTSSSRNSSTCTISTSCHTCRGEMCGGPGRGCERAHGGVPPGEWFLSHFMLLHSALCYSRPFGD